jgi:hypothetical protein
LVFEVVPLPLSQSQTLLVLFGEAVVLELELVDGLCGFLVMLRLLQFEFGLQLEDLGGEVECGLVLLL